MEDLSPPAPGRSVRVYIAWVLILAAAGAMIYSVAAGQKRQAARVAGIQFDFRSKYSIGCKLLFYRQGRPNKTYDDMAAEVRGAAVTPAEHFKAIIVIARLQTDQAGLAEARHFLRTHPPQDLADDARALASSYAPHARPFSPAVQQRLESRYGWYGQLAVAHDLPDGDAAAAADGAAEHTVIVLLSAALVGGLFLIAGLVLFIVLVTKWSGGDLPIRYRPSDPRVCDALVEGFAVYLCGLAGLSIGLRFLSGRVSLAWSCLLVVPVLAAVYWARFRGISGRQFTESVGWHWGRGVVREAFAGIVGYIAGLPLLATAGIICLFLARFSHTTATHPADYQILAGGWTRVLLFFLACVLAPITEELMFRGMLLRQLTLRHSWMLSAIAVSLLFAAIHPQGWTAIPLLATIGLVLALIRVQRDSLVASMTAHALNNFIALMALLLVMG